MEGWLLDWFNNYTCQVYFCMLKTVFCYIFLTGSTIHNFRDVSCFWSCFQRASRWRVMLPQAFFWMRLSWWILGVPVRTYWHKKMVFPTNPRFITDALVEIGFITSLITNYQLHWRNYLLIAIFQFKMSGRWFLKLMVINHILLLRNRGTEDLLMEL